MRKRVSASSEGAQKSSHKIAAPQWRADGAPASRKMPKKPSHSFTIATCCGKKFLT
jgi:hypothetical protein